MSSIAENVAQSAPRAPLRVGAFREDAEQGRAIERVKAWTRQYLELAANNTVVVAEVACGLPGCPPLETVVTFWTGGATRHWFKVFKPVAKVIVDDLPPAWLKPALCASERPEFACC